MDQKTTVKQRLTGILTFLYNSEEGKILGRGARSWGEIGLFYLVYYACLTGFFVALMAIFHQTLDYHTPKLLGKASLLKGNPGVGFKPMPDVATTLIRYDRKNQEEVDKYVENIHKYIQKYINITIDDNFVDCDGDEMRLTETTACRVNLSEVIDKCGKDFGYKEGKPCILLKLNKIFDWKPEPFDVDNLPDGMSDSLKTKYDNTAIWLSCEGENPGDADNLRGVDYYPSQGFPMRYYPYRNQKGYLQPLIMAHLKNIEPHVGIMIECKAWAKNIVHSRMFVEGSIHFEILID